MSRYRQVLVEEVGFEPTTTRVSGECSTAELLLVMFGGTGGIRTHVIPLKRRMLNHLSYSPLVLKKGLIAPDIIIY